MYSPISPANFSVMRIHLLVGYGSRVAFGVRKWLLVISALVLVGLSHTPTSWPTYPIALVPLLVLWRTKLFAIQWWFWQLIEAVLVGCAVGWVSTRFVTPALPFWGVQLHLSGCLVYSSLTVAIAFGLRWTRSFPLQLAALITAVVATVVEFIQARTLGVTWILSSPGLAIASTQIAQWSGVLTPFGLSAVLYWINLSWLPDYNEKKCLVRWAGPVLAMNLTVGLWLGGILLESRVAFGRLPFTALLVQPSIPSSLLSERQVLLQEIEAATKRSITTYGPPDLVLWPETCLWDSPYPASTVQNPVPGAEEVQTEGTEHPTSTMTLAALQHDIALRYQTNYLVGVCLVEQAMTNKYGLNVPEIRRYNCGCLVTLDGQATCHEKLAVMPIREGFPYWFDWQWLRNIIRRNTNVNPNIVEGRNFRTLKFRDQTGKDRTIAVAICYESWFPWLPQYHCKEPLDAICHLAYDGDFKDHPEYTQRMLLTIRLRAIETRTWQLVCTHYSGTAVIDPRGRIVKQLPPGPGVLRTDQLE
jgi:apolipoprotein N-acyltransferase